MIEKIIYKTFPDATVDFYIGQCGSGKSTLACKTLLGYKKKGYNIYSNTYMKGAYKFDISDLMSYDFGEYAVLWIDEGAVSGLASRGQSYKKSNTDNVIEFFQKYRHHKVEKIIITCPDFDDVIPVTRNRADKIIYIQRSRFFNFILLLPNLILKRIFHKSTIDFSSCKFCGQKTDINSDKKKGGKLEKFQYWIPLKRKWFLLNPYRKYFKSFAPRELPKKNWTTWETENIIDDSEIPEIYYPKKSLKEKLKEKIKVFKTSQGERKEKDVKQDS